MLNNKILCAQKAIKSFTLVTQAQKHSQPVRIKDMCTHISKLACICKLTLMRLQSHKLCVRTCACAHARTHTHTLIHTHTHITNAYARRHAGTQCKNTNLNSCKHTPIYVHTHIHTYSSHTYTNANTHTYKHARTYTYSHAFQYTRTCVRSQTRMHT